MKRPERRRLPNIARLTVTLTGLIALLVGTILPAIAQQVPSSVKQIQRSFAPVVRKAAPAVVNIFSRRVLQRRRSPFFDDPFFRRFFGDGFGGMPRRRVQNSLGSGVIVSADGFIVTNYHVIKGGTEIQAVLTDGREFRARVVLKDERTDLAVLKIKAARKLPFLEFHDSDDLEVGDLVLAIGNPFGVGQTVTSGIVSATARNHAGISDFQFFIQTDAAINPGNSGGALVNLEGDLIGINTAIFSRSGGSNGIGFAIPANMVKTVVDSARSGRPIRRPWLGAALQKVTPEISESLGLSRPRGVLVKALHPNGPAARAGLRRGDIIVGIEGRRVVEPKELNYRIATKRVGAVLQMKYLRAGRERAATVKLGSPPNDPPRNDRILRGEHPFSGARVGNLSPALAARLKMDPMISGVIVIDPGRSVARRSGLRRGDVIISVSGVAVTRVRQLARLIDRPRREWVYSVRRGKRILHARVGG